MKSGAGLDGGGSQTGSSHPKIFSLTWLQLCSLPWPFLQLPQPWPAFSLLQSYFITAHPHLRLRPHNHVTTTSFSTQWCSSLRKTHLKQLVLHSTIFPTLSSILLLRASPTWLQNKPYSVKQVRLFQGIQPKHLTPIPYYLIKHSHTDISSCARRVCEAEGSWRVAEAVALTESMRVCIQGKDLAGQGFMATHSSLLNTTGEQSPTSIHPFWPSDWILLQQFIHKDDCCMWLRWMDQNSKKKKRQTKKPALLTLCQLEPCCPVHPQHPLPLLRRCPSEIPFSLRKPLTASARAPHTVYNTLLSS